MNDPTSMPVQEFYCTSCNSRFVARGDDRACPRCGSILADFDDIRVQETALFSTPSPPGLGVNDSWSHIDLIEQELHVYRCDSLLGAGAMGKVYLAHHRSLHRRCALKILSPRVVRHDEDYVARFHTEARTAAALIHPNIVTTHAIGEQDGIHFLEMEYVSGETLQQLIDREGALTPLRATSLAAQIADGLAAAHRAQIVHSDLKADNILLTPHGVPKIADFGLAKQVLADSRDRPRKLVGTPNYMAPELYGGEPADKRSDVYALGVCYFLMLSGTLPYRAHSFADLEDSVRNTPLPSIRELAPAVSLEMAEALALLLSKAPTNRPRDGIEAAQLLRAVLGEVRDIESLLRDAFPHDDAVTWTREGLNYTVLLSLPDGRRQRLFVEPSGHPTAERLLLIYSVCCEAQPEYYEHALRLNSEIAHGAIALREIDGRPYFVMVNAYPRGTVDVEEIRRSVLEIGFRADEVEHRLTGLDHH